MKNKRNNHSAMDIPAGKQAGERAGGRQVNFEIFKIKIFDFLLSLTKNGIITVVATNAFKLGFQIKAYCKVAFKMQKFRSHIIFY